jgi:flagellar P-ring protein precursor FlgI
MKKLLSVLVIGLSGWSAVGAVRLKEIVSIEGVRDNQLMGYGLVVGLAGTGDSKQALFSTQSLTNLLLRMGLSVSPTAIHVKNTAAAAITATLPPFAQAGSRIDVTISAVGDASSLSGGVLLMTGLQGPDGQVYAVAQGPMAMGGFLAASNGNSQSVNHPTVARIPNGAIVERGAPSVALGSTVRLQLQRADFTTATRVVETLNKRFGEVAHAENAALITVTLPSEFQKNTAEFVAEMERLTIEPDRGATIVVNERTGTIVVGKDVQIAPVAILQGSLSVEIQNVPEVSQPAGMSAGTTQVVQRTTVAATQEAAKNIVLNRGATVEELVHALTAIGSSPRDVISILQNLKAAGALDAELAVI